MRRLCSLMKVWSGVRMAPKVLMGRTTSHMRAGTGPYAFSIARVAYIRHDALARSSAGRLLYRTGIWTTFWALSAVFIGFSSTTTGTSSSSLTDPSAA